MYFSQVTLNPARRTTRDLVASPQRLHAALLGCFLPGTAERGRILWRLDRPDKYRYELFVVSPEQPSMESLIDQAGWPGQPSWRTADYDRLLESLQEGQEWVFRLLANPVSHWRDEKMGPGARGVRLSAIDARRKREDRDGLPRLGREDILTEWLAGRGKSAGFEIPVGEAGANVRVVDHGPTQFWRGTGGEKRRVTISLTSFEGVLRVLDPIAFRSALTEGIGPAKGYGCGLLTIAKR